MFAKKNQKTFSITTMHCEHCKQKVEEAIKTIPNVKKVEVSLENQEAKVTYINDIDVELLKKKIKELDYEIEEKN